MKRFLFIATCMLLLFGTAQNTIAQQEEKDEYDTLIPDNVLMEKQWGLGALIQTNGWGLRFRIGKGIRQ